MSLSLPKNARRIVIGGETAWMWEFAFDTQLASRRIAGSGLKIRQGPYQVDLENTDKDGQDWHTVHWSRLASSDGFAGGRSKNESGHMDEAEFVQLAERLIAGLRRRDRPPTPPQTDRVRPNPSS